MAGVTVYAPLLDGSADADKPTALKAADIKNLDEVQDELKIVGGKLYAPAQMIYDEKIQLKDEEKYVQVDVLLNGACFVADGLLNDVVGQLALIIDEGGADIEQPALKASISVVHVEGSGLEKTNVEVPLCQFD